MQVRAISYHEPLTMFALIICLSLHLTSDTAGTTVNWDNTKNWKIYALNNSAQVFSIPVDSVPVLTSIPLGDDSMHILLKSAKILHVPASPAWMGCYLTSCENEKGALMKIVVSQYGSFFLNDYDGNYYQLDARSTRLWLDYMRRSYIKTE
jgi:hypothetical protein